MAWAHYNFYWNQKIDYSKNKHNLTFNVSQTLIEVFRVHSRGCHYTLEDSILFPFWGNWKESFI